MKQLVWYCVKLVDTLIKEINEIINFHIFCEYIIGGYFICQFIMTWAATPSTPISGRNPQSIRVETNRPLSHLSSRIRYLMIIDMRKK